MLITPHNKLCPGGWEQGQEPHLGHGKPQASSLPGSMSLPWPQGAGGRADLPSPAGRGTSNAPRLHSWSKAAGRSPQPPELTCPGQSWPVGSGHTQLHPDQSSREAPRHPSATTLHSQVLPRQVCCLQSCLRHTAALRGAQHLQRSRGKKHLPSTALEGFAGSAEPTLLPRQRPSLGHSSRAEAVSTASSLRRAEMLSRPKATLLSYSCLLCEFGEGGKKLTTRPKTTLQPPATALGEQLAHSPLPARAAGSRAGAGSQLTQKPLQPGHRPEQSLTHTPHSHSLEVLY